MSRILIGTASWTDKSLIDSSLFYPPVIKRADERLRYYATQFPLVEVDSAYNALPSARNSCGPAEHQNDSYSTSRPFGCSPSIRRRLQPHQQFTP
jgi:uncharacterized protein YecE (DUF72 family)